MTNFVLPAFLSILLFEMFALLRMSDDAGAILKSSIGSARILTSQKLLDEEKEALTRRASIEIFKSTICLGGKLLLCGITLYGTFILATLRFPERRHEIFESFVSPVAIFIFTLTVVIYARIRSFVRRRV